MLIFKKVKDIENHLQSLRKKRLQIGFVPTMGALHAGHISLIQNAGKQCDITVCSVFVNPTQFNDKGDFDKYPNTIEKDIEMLVAAGCDILFLPNVKEMYPDGFENKKPVDFGPLAQILEGEHRPGHFDGMAQIVTKLLHAVKPNKLYMGQKDYQQQLIVGELIKQLKLKTILITVPTMREPDGLAMSSRNVRLDETSRKLAVQISQTLKATKAGVKGWKADIAKLQREGLEKLQAIKQFEPEYYQIRNAKTLQAPVSSKEKLVALTAVKVGGVRLIDNMLLN